MNFLRKATICLAVGLCALGIGVLGQHDIYLITPNTIPSYCQETGIWCGAATAQMILEGYPGGVDHPFTQTHIWSRIQAHRDDLGVNWATDPDGLRDTLMELGGDPGVHWSIFSDPVRESVMFDIVYWMTRRRYPTAALVYGFQHWINITGFTTDIYPAPGGTVTLQMIEIIDPWNPPCSTASSGGAYSLMTGSSWYTNYWYSPGIVPASKWHGNYIAVVEPPVQGMAVAEEEDLGPARIDPEKAINIAVSWIEEMQFFERPRFSAFRAAEPLWPLLSNEEEASYYIVPFGLSGETNYSVGAVAVNGMTGQPQEIVAFPRPLTYLYEEEAAQIAKRFLCRCTEKEFKYRARLIFWYSEQARSRFLPVWEIEVLEPVAQLVFVAMDRQPYLELVPSPLGD